MLSCWELNCFATILEYEGRISGPPFPSVPIPPGEGRGDGGCNATRPLRRYARPEKVQQQHCNLAQGRESANGKICGLKGRIEGGGGGGGVIQSHQCPHLQDRASELRRTNEISKKLSQMFASFSYQGETAGRGTEVRPAPRTVLQTFFGFYRLRGQGQGKINHSSQFP